ISNLQRQILFKTSDVGRSKTEAGAAALEALNPHVAVEAVSDRLTEANAAARLNGVDLILDGSDNFATRRIVNAAAIGAGVPLLSGAIGRWDGQVSLFHPAEGGPCYACLFPKDPQGAAAAPCEEAGVVGALAGVVGAMMGLEAIKRLTGAGETLLGRLWLYDALEASVRVIRIQRDPDCALCRSVAPAR
ncbi:MAG: HesA/MoeB/ThiF family protein, partial [Pseudomonadota bacterium]